MNRFSILFLLSFLFIGGTTLDTVLASPDLSTLLRDSTITIPEHVFGSRSQVQSNVEFVDGFDFCPLEELALSLSSELKQFLIAKQQNLSNLNDWQRHARNVLFMMFAFEEMAWYSARIAAGHGDEVRLARSTDVNTARVTVRTTPRLDNRRAARQAAETTIELSALEFPSLEADRLAELVAFNYFLMNASQLLNDYYENFKTYGDFLIHIFDSEDTWQTYRGAILREALICENGVNTHGMFLSPWIGELDSIASVIELIRRTGN